MNIDIFKNICIFIMDKASGEVEKKYLTYFHTLNKQTDSPLKGLSIRGAMLKPLTRRSRGQNYLYRIHEVNNGSHIDASTPRVLRGPTLVNVVADGAFRCLLK